MVATAAIAAAAAVRSSGQSQSGTRKRGGLFYRSCWGRSSGASRRARIVDHRGRTSSPPPASVRCGGMSRRRSSVSPPVIPARSPSLLASSRSDFLDTNFTIYDCQAPHNGAKPSNSRASRRFFSKQISPQVLAGNFEVGQVSYKFNLLKSRGPRRMVYSLNCPSNGDKHRDDIAMKKLGDVNPGQTILRNKAPRWHEQLQCWCLNFHGRVTVASVKNFQLVATADPSQPGLKGDEDTILLQFGKVGDDLFTMDYREPLSAFLAFAICLTSFGTKIACE